MLSGGELAASMLGWLTERPALWLAGGRLLTVWERRGGAGRFQTFHLTFSALFWLARTPLFAWVLRKMEHAHTHTHTATLKSILFQARACALENGGIVFQYTARSEERRVGKEC